MNLNPDAIVFWRLWSVPVNATLVCTWIVVLLLTAGARWLTARLSDEQPSRWQGALEVVVTGMRDQIGEVGQRAPGAYLPYVGTLFLFIATCNVLAVVPGFVPPTGSLSTTVALALTVFIAVPAFGIAASGPLAYLRHYLQPSPLMLPLTILGEVSRTVSLAVRLYGNVMAGSVIGAILLMLVPLVLPVAMQVFGLVTGLIQAYIFAVLATVYIASATVSGDTADQE